MGNMCCCPTNNEEERVILPSPAQQSRPINTQPAPNNYTSNKYIQPTPGNYAGQQLSSSQNARENNTYGNKVPQPVIQSGENFNITPQDLSSPGHNKQEEKENNFSGDEVLQHDAMNKINEVRKEIVLLSEQIKNFFGPETDKTYIYINEMLTRSLIKLDNIDTLNDKDIRAARREVIKLNHNTMAQLKQIVEEYKKTVNEE